MGLTQKLGTIPLAILTDASNNVGIGAAPSGTYKFEVTGTGKFTGDLTVNTLTIGKGGGNLSNNTALGYNVLVGNTTGNYNVGVGTNALSSLGTGSNNTVIGYTAGISIYSGSNNTIVGIYAGSSTLSNNIILADGAGNIKFQYDGSKTIIGQSNNVLIGGTTDAGYKLDVTGTGRFTDNLSLTGSTAKVIGGDSVGRLVLANSTQTTYGIFYGATNATPNITTFVNNSALTLTLNANNTATFSSSVNIASTTTIGGIDGSFLRTYSATNDALRWAFINSSSGVFSIQQQGDGYANQGDRLVINRSGNVGIGTSSPDASDWNASARLLHIYQNTTNGSVIKLESSNASGVIGVGNDAMQLGTITSDPLLFFTATTEKMKLIGNGDLYLTGRSTTAGLYTILYNDNNQFAINASGNSTGKTINFNPSSTFTAMSITSGGTIEATSNSTTAYSLTLGTTQATSPNIVRFYSATDTNNTNQFIMCDAAASVQRMSVRTNGGIYNYTTNNVILSDERLKKDITPLESVWDKVKGIEIVKYKFKDQSHDDFNMGVIAQQVELIAPELIDLEGFGTLAEDGTPYKGIYESDIHYYSIKALQECMSKLEEQQATITSLQDRLTKGGL